jgi:hypothetical protein
MASKIINPKLIDTKCRFQNGNTCVLLAYSLGASYFTEIDSNAFFEAYYRNFGLNFNNAEKTYDDDFNKSNDERWRNFGNGQKLIEILHKESFQPEFIKARKKFDVKYVESTKTCLKGIKNTLIEGSLMTLTLNLKIKGNSGVFKNWGTHTVLTGWIESEKNFFIIETTHSLYFEDLKHINDFNSSEYLLKKHPRFEDIKTIVEGTYSEKFSNIRFEAGDCLLLTVKS